MKYSDPKNLAFLNALAVAGIFIAGFLFFNLLFSKFTFWAVFLLAFWLFGFTYFIYYFTLQKFIYEKIRLIYKTIHSLKIPKDSRKTIEFKSDIDLVNQEVAEWAKGKKLEIDELKKLEVYRRDFLGNVSHELKTPIFNIQGYILTLLDGGLEDPTINKEYLRRTNKSINRLIAIVEDLEAISHLESGELKVNFVKFDIASLAREVIEFLEIKANKRRITVGLSSGYERPVLVFADKEKIRQVLINLVDNAIKYCGVQDGTVKISFFDMDENILAEVTDNGVGMAPQELTRVFERFYRTDKSRSREQGGTGLGLAIVKHIIEAHDQTINVRSTIGVGTTFAFTLKKG